MHNSFAFKTLLLPIAVAAAPSIAQAEADTIEETEIWGTQIKSNSLFLGESDIAIKQADHLSDLLREIPGVDIGGTHSVNARINFRGLDDRDLAVFIDNAPQTNYLYHHMGNLLINTDILKQAEIELGANSVVHGGLGGSIRFETKDAADLLSANERSYGARFMAGYQSNAQASASVTAFGRSGVIDAIGYFHEVDRDNFQDGDGRDTIGSDGTTKNYLFKLGAQITDDQRIEASFEKVDDAGDYTQRPDMGVQTNVAITGDILLPTEYERETINLGYEIARGPLFDARITAYSNDMSLWRDERNGLVRGVATIKEGEADNQGINLFATTELSGQHLLTYGVEYFEQNLIYRPDLIAASPAVRENGESLAIFLQDEISLGSLTVTPGLRWNDFKKDLEATGSSGSWDELSLAFAADYEITDGLNILASYTELFKGPELAEVFVGGAAEKIVNPGVAPETGENIEVGLRYSTALGNAAINVGFNLFQTTIDDYIVEDAVSEDSELVWDVNAGQARIDGGEASLNVSFPRVGLLLTYASSELDASRLELDQPGDSLREIGDSMSFEASFRPLHNLDVIYGARHTFAVDTVTDVTKESYTLHNLSLAWHPTSALALTGGIENLFDETYTSHASRVGEVTHPVFGELLLDDVEPGRNVKVSLAYTF